MGSQTLAQRGPPPSGEFSARAVRQIGEIDQVALVLEPDEARHVQRVPAGDVDVDLAGLVRDEDRGPAHQLTYGLARGLDAPVLPDAVRQVARRDLVHASQPVELLLRQDAVVGIGYAGPVGLGVVLGVLVGDEVEIVVDEVHPTAVGRAIDVDVAEDLARRIEYRDILQDKVGPVGRV